MENMEVDMRLSVTMKIVETNTTQQLPYVPTMSKLATQC